MLRRQLIANVAAALTVCMATVGCADSRKAVYPVRGQVLDAKGKPAIGALIVFSPLGAPEGADRASARVAENGEFQLTSYMDGDGAPPGEYAVTITWPTPKKTPFDDEGPDQLRGAYADARNPKVKFTVDKKPDNQVPVIKLQ